MLTEIAAGEDSTRQFKRDIRNAQSLAAEIAAFSNGDGGTIFIGVADDGAPVGLETVDVGRVNQLISNAASHLVRSPVTVTTANVLLENGRVVIALTVPRGLDKPYFDNSGVIWLKSGADKRRVNSKEELRRLFQVTDQFHADELPTRATGRDLDLLRLRGFLRDAYERDLPDSDDEMTTLLRNLNLALPSGQLNLAGLLLLGEAPQRIEQCIDYSRLYRYLTTAWPDRGHTDLLETLAHDLLAFAFQDATITAVRVRLAKLDVYLDDAVPVVELMQRR